MNKKLILITSFLFFGGLLTAALFFLKTPPENLTQKKEIVYENPFFGYQIILPQWWKEKYTVQEEENRVSFLYVKDVKKPLEKKEIIFSLFAFSPSSWEKEKFTAGPTNLIDIYSDNDLVFAYNFPLENPYSLNASSSPEAEEFQRMVGDLKEIMKTFNYDPKKIPCAREKEKINKDPLLGPTIRNCCQDLIEWRISKDFSVCLKEDKEGIIVEKPAKNERIKSPVEIKGKAKGYWFFEGQFIVQALDELGEVLGTGLLTATEDWMKDDFVSFEGELEFFSPEGEKGFLLFYSANPSGLPENQKIFQIPIFFEKITKKKVLLYYYQPEKDKDASGNIKCSKDGLIPVEREIPVSITPIQDTIRLLLKGKENLTPEEKKQGITTEFPLESFQLKSVNLREDGTLILEFDDPLNKTLGGACRTGLLWFQIEATAKQFPEVKKVEFLPKNLFQP